MRLCRLRVRVVGAALLRSVEHPRESAFHLDPIRGIDRVSALDGLGFRERPVEEQDAARHAAGRSETDPGQYLRAAIPEVEMS